MELVEDRFLRWLSTVDPTKFAGNVRSGAETLKVIAQLSRGSFGISIELVFKGED